MEKINERDPVLLALKAGEQKLDDVLQRLAVKQKELATATEKYLSRPKSLGRSKLESEADELLNGGQSKPSVNADDIEALQHDIEVAELAVEQQRQIVDGLRGQFSVKVCAANRDQYVEIEKRISRAVVELAAANEAEVLFINELRDAGCSTIIFRPMRVDQVGLISDPNSRASHHRRELEEFCPEAVAP